MPKLSALGLLWTPCFAVQRLCPDGRRRRRTSLCSPGCSQFRSNSFGTARVATCSTNLHRHTLTHNTTMPSPHCAACAPWAVGRHSTGRKARGPRATGVERGDHDFPNSALPTCRVVRTVEHRPTAWGGACPALGHNTTTPSPHCPACAPWVIGTYSTQREASGPRATGLE